MRFVVVKEITVVVLFDTWHRQEFGEFGRTAAGTTSRAATAVGSREGLVQVQMDHICAHIARSGNAHKRIHVRPVHIDEAARSVNDLTNLFEVGLKNADRIRICDHQSGNAAFVA
jgi:hypothetical protein